jgi:hypothetical protein
MQPYSPIPGKGYIYLKTSIKIGLPLSFVYPEKGFGAIIPRIRTSALYSKHKTRTLLTTRIPLSLRDRWGAINRINKEASVKRRLSVRTTHLPIPFHARRAVFYSMGSWTNWHVLAIRKNFDEAGAVVKDQR